MLNRIEPIIGKSYNCYASVMLTIAYYYRREYELLYSETCGFSFNHENDGRSIGEKLSLGSRYNLTHLLDKYYGIKCSKLQYRENAYEKIVNLIKKDVPVIVCLDSYWCPWNRSYQKYHQQYYCLAVDSNADYLICLDTYQTRECKHITPEMLRIALLHVFMCEVAGPAFQINYTEVLNSFCLHLVDSEGKSIYRNIIEFAEALEFAPDLTLETKHWQDTFAVPLFVQLKEIEIGRINFAEFLLHLSKKCGLNLLAQAAELYEQSSALWKLVGIRVMQVCIAPINAGGQRIIAEKIKYIVEFERKAGKTLIQIVRGNMSSIDICTNLSTSTMGKVDNNNKLRTVDTAVTRCKKEAVQKNLIDIWSTTLSHDNFTENDSFFSLGGDSALLVVMYSELIKHYPYITDIVDLFMYPTINSLSEHILDKEPYSGMQVFIPDSL